MPSSPGSTDSSSPQDTSDEETHDVYDHTRTIQSLDGLERLNGVQVITASSGWTSAGHTKLGSSGPKLRNSLEGRTLVSLDLEDKMTWIKMEKESKEREKKLSEMQYQIATLQKHMGEMKNGNSNLQQQVLSLENSLKNALELLTMARADVQKSTSASSSENKAPEADDPYTDYLNQCHKYGRQFNCEAMVSFTSKSQVLRISKISDDDVLPLCMALKRNSYVTSIEICGGLADTGAIHLAEALKMNTNIVDVDLVNCGIKVFGAQALAEWLKKSYTARAFSLAGCEIRDQGALHVANALKHNKYLTILDMSRCCVGDEGAAAIADALRVNRKLTSIDLKHNRITEAGAQALAKAVQKNGAKAINSLNLGGNNLLPESQWAAELQKAIHFNLGMSDPNETLV